MGRAVTGEPEPRSAESATPRVVCAGHVNWDVTLKVDRLPEPDGEATVTAQHQSGGGSASNVAGTLATLDVGTALLGSVGTDDNGHLARRTLVEAGVDCSALVTAEGDTSVKYLVVDADGQVMVLGNDGVNEAFAAEDLPAEALSAASHLHLTSQRPRTAARLAERASEAGVRVSFDPGRRIGDRDFGPTLELADVLFLNEREAETAVDRSLANGTHPDQVVVVKLGSGGAEVLTPDGRSIHQGAFDVDVVDTTGAGDAFAAGFIATLVDDGGAGEDGDHGPPVDDDRDTDTGPDYEHALAVANACGALAAGTQGARTHPSWEAVRALLGT